MKVCLATGEFIPALGGIATYTHNLACLLARGGYDVTVVTAGEQVDGSKFGYSVVSVDKEAHVEENRLRQVWPGYPPALLRHVSAGLAMRKWLDSNAETLGFDVIEVPEFGGYGVFLASLDLPPLAVTCHGSYGQMLFYQEGSRSSAKYRVLVGMEAMLLGLSDVVTAYSPANAQAWSDYLGRDVRFVPAPWTEAVRNDAAKNCDRAEDAVVEGIVVGRLQNLKGVLEMSGALSESRRRGIPVRITWIGRDTATAPGGGSMLGYIQERYPDIWGTSFRWIERMGREETRQAQAAADFAVVPSQWETLNFTAVEAMSVGTPVIISSGAGASYLVKDGESGFVVPPMDVTALAEAVERMVGNEPLRREMGLVAQEVIRREFDPEQVVAARIETYEAAIRRRSLRREKPFLAPAAGLVTELLGMERGSNGGALLDQPRRFARTVRKQLRQVRAAFQGWGC